MDYVLQRVLPLKGAVQTCTYCKYTISHSDIVGECYTFPGTLIPDERYHHINELRIKERIWIFPERMLYTCTRVCVTLSIWKQAHFMFKHMSIGYDNVFLISGLR